MNKGIVLFLFVIGILIVSGVMFYIFYESPKDKHTLNPPSLNMTIRMLEGDKQVSSGYIIDVSNTLYRSGISSDNSYIIERLPENLSFCISNYNLENQEYKIQKKCYNYLNIQEVKNIVFNLEKKQNFTISQIGSLNDNLFINVSSNTTIFLNKICFRNSASILLSGLYNYTLSSTDSRLYSKVDKCFLVNENITSNSTIYPIKFLKMGNLREDDYIKITLVDCEPQWFSNNCESQDLNKTDVGLRDQEFYLT